MSVLKFETKHYRPYLTAYLYSITHFPFQKEGSDKVKKLLEESSAKLRKSSLDKIKERSHFKSPHSVVSSVKEESSDESTIISSQTSTLTRNQGNQECWYLTRYD